LQRCPACDNVLTADTINIKEGVALCPKCGKLSRLSELTYSDRSIQEILSKPPAGCSIIALDHGVIARASLRSVSGFIFPALFALFWNGVISLFVSQAIAGLYANLIGPVPEWFPSPGLKDGMPHRTKGRHAANEWRPNGFRNDVVPMPLYDSVCNDRDWHG
jgi:hypothetical protein